MTVSGNTKTVKSLGDFFNTFVKKQLMLQKIAKKVFNKPGRTLEMGANVGSAFASRSFKAVLSSLPEVINFYRTVKCLLFGNFV